MDRLGKFLRIVKIAHFRKHLARIIDYQLRYSFQNCFHYLILFLLKQIEKKTCIYRHGWNNLVVERFQGK